MSIILFLYCEHTMCELEYRPAFISDNVCAYLTFEWGRSKPDEHKTFSSENVRGWLLSEDPIQMWPNNSD
jgi:hypothetical protein